MKYIVYCTTNLVNKKIYVGVHKTENPDIFDGYLGNNVYTNNKYSYQCRKYVFAQAVNKYGPKNFIRKTLAIFDTEEEALKLEAEIVNEDFIRRKDTYNVALGGGLPTPIKKQIYQYDLEGNFIKEWLSIREASTFYKCSESSIGRAVFDRTPSMKYLWTDYKYEKIDINTFKIDENKTYTYLYDIDGELINEFESLSECARYLEVNPADVHKAISGKFSIKKNWYASDIKYDFFPIPEIKNYKNMPLYQYDLKGNFIKEWENYGAVKKYFGKNINIHASIRLGQTCQGFQWSWEKLPCMKEVEHKSGRIRKVGKYTKEGELVAVFNSVTEAKKDTCGAPNVLSGKRKSAGGHIFKYIDD